MKSPSAPKARDAAASTAAAAQRTRLSFRTQRLEAQVPAALAASVVWVAVFLRAGLAAWLIAAVAVGVASWARRAPARRTSLMMLRAILLVAAGFLLIVAEGFDSAGPAWTLWLAITCSGYALLLPARHSGLLLVCSLLAFAAACVLAQPVPPWPVAFAYACTVIALPLLVTSIAQAMRANERLTEQAVVDKRSQLYNEEGFFAHGGELFDDCRRRGKPFALALLCGADLWDASDVLGKRAAAQLFKQVVQGVAAAAGSGGIGARTDSVEFALVLPGATAQEAQAAVHARLGEPPSVAIELDGAKASILLDVVLAEATSDVHTLEELYDVLHRRLRERGASPTSAPAPRSTIKGLLMRDPPVPPASKPTLPMPLKRSGTKTT